ncbi:hypothetical protein AOLI_G00165450 [Acnodon oligacanthus]
MPAKARTCAESGNAVTVTAAAHPAPLIHFPFEKTTQNLQQINHRLQQQTQTKGVEHKASTCVLQEPGCRHHRDERTAFSLTCIAIPAPALQKEHAEKYKRWPSNPERLRGQKQAAVSSKTLEQGPKLSDRCQSSIGDL